MTKHYYGWVRQLPDIRDIPFKVAPAVVATLPDKADVGAGLPPALNQLTLGSCGPNAVDALIWHDQVDQGVKPYLARGCSPTTTRAI